MAWMTLRVFAVLLADVDADLDVTALNLVVERLADIMQQTGTAGQLDIDTQLAGHQASQPGHFQRMAQHILAEAGAVLQTANELDQVGMQAVNAQLHNGFVALALHLNFQFAAALVDSLLDAGRVDTAISNQSVPAPCGRPHGGSGQSWTVWIASGVSSMMRSQPVAVSRARMLRPSRPMMRPFISSLGSGNNADGGLAGGVSRAAGNGLANQLTGEVVALILHVSLVGADLHSLFVGQFVVHLLPAARRGRPL